MNTLSLFNAHIRPEQAIESWLDEGGRHGRPGLVQAARPSLRPVSTGRVAHAIANGGVAAGDSLAAEVPRSAPLSAAQVNAAMRRWATAGHAR